MRPPTASAIDINPRFIHSTHAPSISPADIPSPLLPTTTPPSTPPRSSPLNPNSPPSPSQSSAHRRRRSYSSSFLGSFTSSLLAMRMPSAPSSPEVTFSARIRLPSVEALTLSFVAQFYSIASPYVGDITLPISYPIPSKGSVQVVVLNPEDQPLKAFVVPYDARSLKLGERTYVRQMCYAPSSDGLKEVLCYAVQFQLICELADEPNDEPQGDVFPFEMEFGASPRRRSLGRKPKKRVHLCPSIRAVFASRAPDDEGPLRTHTESPSLSVPASPPPQLARAPTVGQPVTKYNWNDDEALG